MADVSDKVGGRKIFKNDKIVVWNFELEPGEETPMHRHDKSYIWYAIQGGQLDCEDEHGNDLGIFEVPTGSVYDIRCENDELEVMSEIAKRGAIPGHAQSQKHQRCEIS